MLGKLEGVKEPWHVYTTGHSMGGALATLCAYELASDPFDEVRILQPMASLSGA